MRGFLAFGAAFGGAAFRSGSFIAIASGLGGSLGVLADARSETTTTARR